MPSESLCVCAEVKRNDLELWFGRRTPVGIVSLTVEGKLQMKLSGYCTARSVAAVTCSVLLLLCDARVCVCMCLATMTRLSSSGGILRGNLLRFPLFVCFFL